MYLIIQAQVPQVQLLMQFISIIIGVIAVIIVGIISQQQLKTLQLQMMQLFLHMLSETVLLQRVLQFPIVLQI